MHVIALLAVVLGLIQKCTAYFPGHIEVKYPEIITSVVPFEVTLKYPPFDRRNNRWDASYNCTVEARKDSHYHKLQETILHPYKKHGYDTIQMQTIGNLIMGSKNPLGKLSLRITVHRTNRTSRQKVFEETHSIFCIPSWLSLLPSLVAIVLSIVLKQSIVALLASIWLGAIFLCQYNVLSALHYALSEVVIPEMTDIDHAAIVYFCFLMGGLISIVGTSGGTFAFVQLFMRFASDRMLSQLVTFAVGVSVFFDDYASCLISGSAMREITGNLRISREKLSFIVDTCASTVASLALVSSWTGIELTYISQEFSALGISEDPYLVFLRSLCYKFYPFLVLFFCLIVILSGRDIGPMLKAERRSVTTGKLVRSGSEPISGSEHEFIPKKNVKLRAINFIAPFLVLILTIISTIAIEGYTKITNRMEDARIKREYGVENGLKEYVQYLSQTEQKTISIFDCLVEGNPFNALLLAALLGTITAVILVFYQKIMKFSEIMDKWLEGAKSMTFAIVILIHAWSLGSVCRRLSVSHYLATLMQNSINPGLIPTMVFILAAVISFSTGSAWGTMSILFPLTIPLVELMTKGQDPVVRVCSVASILSGSVWGNHTSPISDSCIMSSMSTGANLNDHVKSQLVYSLIVGVVSILICTLPVGLGVYEWYTAYAIAAATLLSIIFIFGEKSENELSLGFRNTVDDNIV